MSSLRKKILVVRSDRMGDVMMSLPTLALLRQNLPMVDIDFSYNESLSPLLLPFLEQQNIKSTHVKPNWNEYSGVLFLFAPDSLLWSAFRHRVNLRVGLYSRLVSFVCLSRGLRQKRSLAEKNEGQYNLLLGEYFLKLWLGVDEVAFPEPLCLPGTESSARAADVALEGKGLKGDFILIHPGMGGSALNLNDKQWVELIRKYKSQFSVGLSIGPVEEDQRLKRAIRSEIPDLPVLEGLSLDVLRELFRRASLVIAPSTGPLHLAHYVGTRTLGIYPPVRSQSPDRWSPFGGAGDSEVFAPEVSCPAKAQCLGSSCPVYNCMEWTDWVGRLTGG